MSSQWQHRSARFGIMAFLLMTMALAVGCAHSTPNSGFIEEPAQMTQHKNFPFKKEWYSKDADWSRFKSVYVAQVDTKHLEHMSWWQAASLKGHVKPAEAAELGRDLRERVVTAFQNDKSQRFRVTSTPGPDTLVIELAIVELEPTKAWLNAVEYAGVMAAFSKGYVAIESRWLDGDGRAIATIADGMSGRTTLVSAADLTWWGHAKNAFDAWSGEFVQIADSGWSKRVHARFPVALVTW